jgi:hypothetical protein
LIICLFLHFHFFFFNLTFLFCSTLIQQTWITGDQWYHQEMCLEHWRIWRDWRNWICQVCVLLFFFFILLFFCFS